VRVVVADDAMLTREGIVHLLDQAGVDVVAQADDADGLLREVVGGLDQQVAADAVDLELGSGDLLVAAEGSILNTRDTAADAGRARGQGETSPSMSESFSWHTTRR